MGKLESALSALIVFILAFMIIFTPAFANNTRNGAKLNGVYFDYGIDSDRNGLYEGIAIKVGVIVFSPGNYTIRGSLYNSDGSEVSTTSNHSYLSTRNNYVKNAYLMLYFIGVEASGPRYLKNLTLYDSSGNLLDKADNIYSTKPYDHLESLPDLPEYIQEVYFFDQKTNLTDQAANLSGYYMDCETDTNEDGLYDFLTIGVGVNVKIPGEYTLDGTLYDANGTEVVWSLDHENLSAGYHVMKLNFDGRTIATKRINGPYYLEDLELYSGSSDEGFIPYTINFEGYNTSAYKYTDFANLVSSKEKIISGNGKGELLLTVVIHSVLPVFSGVYSYDLEGINIPLISAPVLVEGSKQGYIYGPTDIYLLNRPSNLAVYASKVKNLNLGLKKLQGSYENLSTVWMDKYNRTFNTYRALEDESETATTTSDLLSPGIYHIKIFGDAIDNETNVNLTMVLMNKVTINGRFDLGLNTTGIPSGDYEITARALNGSIQLDEMALEGFS